MSSSNPLDALFSKNPFDAVKDQPTPSGNPLDQIFKENAPAPTAPDWRSLPVVSSGNPLDQLLIKPQPAETPAPADWRSLPVAGASSSNPLDAIFTKPESTAPLTSGNPFDSLNPLDQLNPKLKGRILTNEEAAYGNSDPEKMETEPWYSQAWEWMNSPLYDLHKWGTRTGAGTFERGLETGLEDIGSGFTSPLQIALTIATFGGGAVEGAGLSVLRSIGVSAEAAPVVARSAKALMDLGFTGQMLGGLITQSPKFLDALKEGDVESATRLGTNLAAGGLFLREGLKHGIEDAVSVKRLYNESRGIKTQSTSEKLAEVSKLAGIYDQKKSMGNDAARSRMEEIRSQLKEAGATDATTQAGIRHFMTQDGDVSRIQKMIGISESTIRPREYTSEEKADIEKIAELHSWVNKSSPILKNEDGAPTTFYLNDSSEGTHKLGQTLSLTGDPEDAHYVQVKAPFAVRSEESLQKYIDQSGGQEAAKAKLQAAGHDGIIYSTNEGPKVITFSADQYRPVEKYQGSNDPTWNREHVFVAVDKKNSDIIRNAGIGKNPQKADVRYFATPEQALKNATLPDSGKKSDLIVFSVPRTEVEAGVRETNAAIHGKLKRGAIGPVEVSGQREAQDEVAYRVRDAGEEGVPSQSHSQATMSLDEAKKYMESRGKIQGKPQEIVAIPLGGLEYDRKPGPNGNDWIKFKKDLPETNVKQLSDVKPSGPSPIADDMLITAKRHMPGHEIELDEKGQPTGRAIPLRPLGAEDMPGDNSRFLAQYSPAEKDQYIQGLKKALNLTPEQQAVAKTLRQIYDNSFTKANDAGLIRSWVEAYHPQAWADDQSGMWNWLFNKNPEKVTNKALNQLRHDTNSGNFDTNINAAKHRAYNTEFQGVMAGEKFKTDDLALHAFNHVKAIDQAIAARDYISSLREKSVRASDGRPAAVLAGTSRVMGAGTENPALAINPNSVKPIRISDDEIERMQQHSNGASNELQEKLQNGTIEKLPWTVENEDGQKVPAYAYSSEGYVAIDHPAMRGWGFSGVDTAGNPAILRGEIMVHPDFADHIRQVVGADKSIIQESALGRGVLKASSEAKGLLLSFSPFHIVQEGLRAMMVGLNPLKYEHLDINENPELQRGVRNGLVRGETRARDQFSTGYASHSTLISKVPGLNRFQSWMQSFLFEKYIPGLKDRAYVKLVQDIRDQNPGLTADEASSRGASMTNDIFGGQNYRKLGISASQQDFFRMTALAPDWLLSEARMLGRAAGLMDKETGVIAQKQMAKQMAAIWLGARVLNMITSGQMHNEAPFGVAGKNDKGEETIYSVRTLPTDLIHIITDPRGFLAGRVNPLVVRPAIEGITGRDEFGRRVTPSTEAADALKNVVPIAAQGSSWFKSNPLSNFDQIVKAGGASVYRYKSEADKLAQQYSSDRMPTGPVSPEHQNRHEEDLYLEDQLRKGRVGRGDVLAKVGKRRADELIRRIPMTTLQAGFDRLPMSESINVWDAATNIEKDQLHTQLWKKRKAWLKEHKPAERESEPVWRKMQNTWADLR